MKNHINTNLDKDFLQIEGLKYLPWVGKSAIQNKSRLLIIAESVYNWEKEEDRRKNAQVSLDKNDFARVVAYEHGIENSSSKRKLARNIEKIQHNTIASVEDRIDFWESILFHELVQRPLPNKKTRPTKADYQIGAKVLTSVIELTKPEKCIFLGTTWAKFSSLKKSLGQYYTIEEKHYDKINNAWPKTLFIKELNTKIYFIKHPSSYFSTELWKNFIDKN